VNLQLGTPSADLAAPAIAFQDTAMQVLVLSAVDSMTFHAAVSRCRKVACCAFLPAQLGDRLTPLVMSTFLTADDIPNNLT